MKITEKKLVGITSFVNKTLKKTQLKIGHRNGFICIDITNKKGGILDSIICGLTKKEAYYIIVSYLRINSFEKAKR